MSKLLLLVTAIVEAATGVALLVAPSSVVALLLSEGLSSSPALILGRITGAALLSIGATCWLSRNSEPKESRGLIIGLLIYNAAIPPLLLYAAIAASLRGIAIWPTCVLHLSLAFWCLRSLRSP